LVVPHPAIENDAQLIDCLGRGHLTSTAYLKLGEGWELFTLYTSRDGSDVLRRARTRIHVARAGTIRVLSVTVKHPETVGDDSVPLWEAAQREVND
jgi:hypothetical protein